MLIKMHRKLLWPLFLAGLSALAIGVSAAEVRTITAAEAIRLAIQNDADLRLANLNLTVANLRLEAAQNVALLPTVGLSVSPPSIGPTGLGQDATAALTASLPLPCGRGSLQASLGLNYNFSTAALVAPTWQLVLTDVLNLANPTESQSSLEASERAVESAERSVAATEQGLVFSTLQAYQGLLSKAQQASQNQASVDRLQGELAQVQELAAQGYKGVQDVNEAKLLLVDARVQAEKSAATYASDLESFCRETLSASSDCQLAPIELPLDSLLMEAHALLAADIPDSTINEASAVANAEQDVADSEESLLETRGGALPSLSLSAKVTAEEWKVGVGLSLSLFSPSRSANIRIAEANLSLAAERLESARVSARNQVLNQQASLLSAVRTAESLDLETEKHKLEEEVIVARRDAGTLSDSDWAAFLNEKDSFAVDAAGRATSLLTAYLTYREALGMDLDWEEWL
ncbi:MAG: TolC family protein [Candidatus Bipolaricaulota bacterium]|nr:TolC family protein [Candidatus Bipolaricaulota bacterium]